MWSSVATLKQWSVCKYTILKMRQTWLSNMSFRYSWPYQIPSITWNRSLESFEKSSTKRLRHHHQYAIRNNMTSVMLSVIFRSSKHALGRRFGLKEPAFFGPMTLLRMFHWRWSIDHSRHAWWCLRVNYWRLSGLRAQTKALQQRPGT